MKFKSSGLVGCCIFLAVSGLIFTRTAASENNVRPQSGAGFDVLTQHNNTDRSGHNPNETILTLSNVNSQSFGKLFDLPVDGQIYGQPLIVTGVQVRGKTRNVVVVATAHNSVYVFDADTSESLSMKNYGSSLPTPNSFWQPDYQDMTPEVGITSTPVIDKETRTIYFTTMTYEYVAAKSVQSSAGLTVRITLRAVDLATQADKYGSPVEIKGSVPLLPNPNPAIRARHTEATAITFVASHQLQRVGLLLNKGQVVLGFGAHADQGEWQGWVFSYSASNLQSPPAIWSSVSTGGSTTSEGAGIWQAGMGFITDQSGDIYLMTGNGYFQASVGNFGDSVVRLSLANNKFTVKDYFTPCNQQCLDSQDLDLGGSGLLHIPGSHYVIGGGKQGKLYLMDADNLGKANTGAPCYHCSTDLSCNNCKDNVVQSFQAGCVTTPHNMQCGPNYSATHIHGSPVSWESDVRGRVVYVWAENDSLRAFSYVKENPPSQPQPKLIPENGCQSQNIPDWMTSAQVSPGNVQHGMTGGMLSISSNKGQNGIVWAVTPTNNDANQKVVPGILRAYDANNLKKELWNSYSRATRDSSGKVIYNPDDFGNFAKNAPPTIANGKVYVSTFSNHLTVYGLNPPQPPPAPTNFIVNGSFENGPTGWTAWDGSKSISVNVSECNPLYGDYNSVLSPTMTNIFNIAQTVSGLPAGNYVLTAYCATNILDQSIAPDGLYKKITLLVSVNGVLSQAQVKAYNGYQKYTIPFNLLTPSAVAVGYIAPKLQYNSTQINPTYAYIDVVTISKATTALTPRRTRRR
ncbi:MAG TPA: hypothetical protein VJX74_15020 [Blastocatellia bacterium]|nr:hypothetical protein [Blastocatellia bacterium]